MHGLDLWVGSYAKAGGRGLYRLHCHSAGLTLGNVDGLFANASYGVWSPKHHLHYFVDESAIGAINVCRADGGGLTLLANALSEGREPCFIAIDPAETRVAVANYASGSVALYDLGENGLPKLGPALWVNAGSGPNVERQSEPHIHCVRFSPDGAHLYATDLGTDQLLRFPLEAQPVLGQAEVAWDAPSGSGPRHLLFHPSAPLALVVCEMASTLTLFDMTAHGLTKRTTISTLPPRPAQQSLGGDLAINRAGTRVYVTNRGHDSIMVAVLDPVLGTLEPVQYVPSGGASPRSLLLLEEMEQLLVVNEEAGNIVQFAITSDGQLRATGHMVEVSGAAFVTRAAG